MRYNNYHKHTHYSNLRTLDCVVKPEDYCKRAVELGHTTYFTTEHGFQGNLFETQTLCENPRYNLKPIYGVEAYYVDDITSKEDRRFYHIMLIGMTKKSRFEINKILSIANTEGFYYKPRIGLKELLSLTPTDTIITTACIAGRMFKGDNWFKGFFIPLKQHFGNNFYLEVQAHNVDSQIEYNKKILEVVNLTKTKIIHANDSHYIYPKDSKYRDMFLQAKGIYYEEENNFILDYPSSDDIFLRYKTQGVLSEEQVKEALENTLIFDNAEPIYTDKEFKIPLVPNEYIEDELGKGFSNKDNDKVLREIIGREFKKRKNENKIKDKLVKTYTNEIMNEVQTVKQCGMASYFVLDHMCVKRAIEKYNAILTRSGRGSAVSFVINNFLGLTEVDRIKAPVKLYPSRFMSAERILNSRSLPDIDLNFADVTPIIQATKDILGEDQIYYMVAYKPLQRSSAFRLWCKALHKPLEEYDEIAKFLSEKSNTDDMFKDTYKDFAQTLEDSKIFRGVIESVAPSPCSFLLSNDPISETIGLIRVGDVTCCCLDGYNCDVYKFLKNDYLTVSVYTIIDKVYKMIGKPIDDISTLVNNCDQKVWDIYEKGLTTTINQVDSDMGKQLIMKYKPKNLGELAAWVAAIRPGFASLLKQFLNREDYSTGVEALDNLLSDSYHYMLYQESIMAFLVWLGIEEKGTYDIIKKISKKKFKEEELLDLKEKLKVNWIKNVGSEEHFEDNWQVVQDAASYSFNASHALSVAIDSLYGAYLKAYYPLEYFSVTLTLYSGDMTRTANLINELNYFNIKLMPIRFGKSKADYSCDKNTNSIYKGISSIKFCNAKIAEELWELSQNKKYSTFIELLKDIKEKTSVNSRQLDILIGLNFFKDFGANKYLINVTKVYDNFIGKKQINKKDVPSLSEKYGLNEDIILAYSEKETKTLYKNVDMEKIVSYIIKKIPEKSFNISEQIAFEMKCLEYATTRLPNVSEKFWIVTNFQVFKNPAKPYLTLYKIKDGKTLKTKIKTDTKFIENPFRLYSILKIDNFDIQTKTEKIGDKWVKTDKVELILEDYEVVSL